MIDGDDTGPYTMTSIVRTRTFADLTLGEVIEEAKTHQAAYSPQYGTQVIDAAGNCVWRSWRDEDPTLNGSGK